LLTGIVVLLFVGSVAAGKPNPDCNKKKEEKERSKQTTVSAANEGQRSSEGQSKDASAPKPVPDPVPQSMKSQVKFLADGLSDLPPDPQPGECYVRVKQNADYEVVREKVLIKEASVRYQTIPAKFKDA